MATSDKHYYICPICEAECGLEIITRDGRIESIRGDEENVSSKGFTCPKSLAIKDLSLDPDRLRYPVRRTGDEWARITWQEAFDEIEKRIRDIRRQYGNNAVALYVGNPNAHYHGNIIYLGFLLRALNTGNRYSASSLDQLPLMMVCYLMFGHQFLFPVPDIDRTDYFLIIGGNPAVSGGSIMTASGVPRRIKNIQQRGGRVVVVDPVLTRTASLADRHLFIRPGTDVFLMAALVNTIFTEGLANPGRLGAFTDNIDTVKNLVRDFTPERAAGITGIGADDIRGLAREFGRAEKAVCYGRMGTCVQEFGTLTTWLIMVFNIITGKMDQPGGFMFPTPALDFVDFLARSNEKGYVARHHSRVSGLPDFAGEFPTAVLAEEILTPGDGQIKSLITIAGNPVLSAPNGRLMDQALGKLEFMVAMDWYVTESSRHAHIILPPTGILEHANFATMANLAGVRNFAGYSRPVLKPAPDTRHNWQILSELTVRVISNPILRGALKMAKPELLLDLMLRFGPHGSGLNIFGSGLTLSRVKRAEHGLDLGPLVPRLPDRLFTRGKRIDLAPDTLVSALKKLNETSVMSHQTAAASGFDLLLISRRNLMSNNSWFHNCRSMRNQTNRCTVMINTEDAQKKSIASGDMVRVSSSVGSIVIEAEISNLIMPGVVSIPHGWGHDYDRTRIHAASEYPGVSVNDITDNKRIDISGNAALSGVPVRIEKAVSGPV